MSPHIRSVPLIRHVDCAMQAAICRARSCGGCAIDVGIRVGIDVGVGIRVGVGIGVCVGVGSGVSLL